MRGPEKIVLIVALVVPLVVAGLGWPMFVRWMGGSSPAAQPQVAGSAATSAATARVGSTPRPATPGLPATPQPVAPVVQATATPGAPLAQATATPAAALAQATATPAAPLAESTRAPAARVADSTSAPRVADSTPTPVARPAGQAQARPAQPTSPATAETGPSAAVSSFYALIDQHQFDEAARLWSPRMRATFPPAENIDRRFGQTQQIVVNRADVVSTDGTRATVAVDLVETRAADRRHYVGTWSVVRGAEAWLLDQPNLQVAP